MPLERRNSASSVAKPGSDAFAKNDTAASSEQPFGGMIVQRVAHVLDSNEVGHGAVTEEGAAPAIEVPNETSIAFFAQKDNSTDAAGATNGSAGSSSLGFFANKEAAARPSSSAAPAQGSSSLGFFASPDAPRPNQPEVTAQPQVGDGSTMGFFHPPSHSFPAPAAAPAAATSASFPALPAKRASFVPAVARESSRDAAPEAPSFSKAASFTGVNKCSRVLQSQKTVSSLLSFAGARTLGDGRASLTEKQKFAGEVEVIRKRLKNISRKTLNPRSRFVRTWDMVTIAALMFTAFVTPFEVAFYEAKLYAGPLNFTTNRIVDLVFVMDIIFSFFMPYRASQREGGMMIYENKRIAIAYIKGWFPLDFITCVPFDLVFAGVAAASNVETDGSSFRLLRMLRIMKLMRIVRASRILSRWQDHVSISFALMSLFKFAFLTVLLAHWLACLWGFIGYRTIDLDDPLLANVTAEDLDMTTTIAWGGYGAGHSWRQKARVPDDANEWQLYGICIYVALNNIFGGSCEMNPGTYAEFFVQGIMLLCGSSVWAYVIGSSCGIIATLDPSRIEYRQTLDELNLFVREQSLPSELAVKLRAYFRNTIYLIRSKRYEVLLQKMSTRLRGDAAYRMCSFQLRSVPFLVHPDLEPEFMCNLAIRYKTMVYSRLERVPCFNLFVVERGVVAKRGKLGVVGTCFGKDVILSNDNLRDIGDAIALTFVQTISLTQQDIFELLPEYPMAYHVVRKAALRMALVRALVKAAAIVKRSRQGNKALSIIEIFDRAMLEASEAAVERQREEEEKKTVMIPLSTKLTGESSETVLKLAQMLAKKKETPKKGGWGKLAGGGLAARLKNAETTAKKNGSPSPTKKQPTTVRLNNLMGKALLDKVKPKTVEESIRELKGSHNEVVERISRLEKSMVTHMEALSTKLEEIGKSRAMTRVASSGSGLQKQRQGRSKRTLARAASGDASNEATNGSTRTEEERNELREAQGQGSSPSVSTPFEA